MKRFKNLVAFLWHNDPLFLVAAAAVGILLVAAIAWAAPTSASATGNDHTALITAIMTALVTAFPLIVLLLKQTSWGKKYKNELDATQNALDHVVDAVGQARRSSGNVSTVLSIMSAKDHQGEAMKDSVAAWKKAVARMDPKKAA